MERLTSQGLKATFAAAMLLGVAGCATWQTAEPAPPLSAAPADRAARLFFLSDVHSRHDLFERFIEAANRERPDLVLDGGDFTHDATESEYRRAFEDRARLASPWYVVPGNHDVALRGPFATPPAIPPFDAVTHQDIRFILLDNADGTLTEEQFGRLEAELDRSAGRRILVVMHVPPFVSRAPALVGLRARLPFRLASPVMSDAAQVDRFLALMAEHDVLAVLTGHTHYFDYDRRGGVHYIGAGSCGGLTPGAGLPHEYVDITITGREVGVRRVRLGDPAGTVLSLVPRAFRFYARLNGFNHRQQGWSYVPSASVQWRTGVERIETSDERIPALLALASFERNLDLRGRHGFFADIGAALAPSAQGARLVAGYKARPMGTFNENVFASASTSANVGARRGRATAGVGIRLGAGIELRRLTAELSHDWSTNQRGAAITLGYRY